MRWLITFDCKLTEDSKKKCFEIICICFEFLTTDPPYSVFLLRYAMGGWTLSKENDS